MDKGAIWNHTRVKNLSTLKSSVIATLTHLVKYLLIKVTKQPDLVKM